MGTRSNIEQPKVPSVLGPQGGGRGAPRRLPARDADLGRDTVDTITLPSVPSCRIRWFSYVLQFLSLGFPVGFRVRVFLCSRVQQLNRPSDVADVGQDYSQCFFVGDALLGPGG